MIRIEELDAAARLSPHSDRAQFVARMPSGTLLRQGARKLRIWFSREAARKALSRDFPTQTIEER